MLSEYAPTGLDTTIIKINKKEFTTFNKWFRVVCKIKLKIFILFQFAEKLLNTTTVDDGRY